MGIPHVPDQYAVRSTQYAPLSTYVACTAYNPVWCLTETYYVIYIYIYSKRVTEPTTYHAVL